MTSLASEKSSSQQLPRTASRNQVNPHPSPPNTRMNEVTVSFLQENLYHVFNCVHRQRCKILDSDIVQVIMKM